MVGFDRALEAHRFSFEGSTSELARHVAEEHGANALLLKDHAAGMTQGDWAVLDDLHRAAHAEAERMSRRRLHSWEATIARFGPTTDSRFVVLPNYMRAQRKINSRPAPLPLLLHEPADDAPTRQRIIGFAVEVHEGMNDTIQATGVLDLNELTQQQRDHLLEGGEWPTAVVFDEVEVEQAKGEPYLGFQYIVDWRVWHVMTGPDYQVAWSEPTTLKLQTGPYADWSRWGVQ